MSGSGADCVASMLLLVSSSSLQSLAVFVDIIKTLSGTDQGN